MTAPLTVAGDDVHTDKAHYYVSAIDGPRTFIIAGPYAAHAAALAQVNAVRDLGVDQNPRAWWFAWGTCGSDELIKTPLGPEWAPPAKPVAALPKRRRK
jgi:hypothetical protein